MNMKKYYYQPIVTIVEINDPDIITSSLIDEIGDGGSTDVIEEARVRRNAIWDD